MDSDSESGHMARELEVEQNHTVSESGVDTYTDVYVPQDIDCIPEEVADTLWEEFGKDAEADLGLTVVDE